MSTAALVQSIPSLLEQGLNVYNTLREEIQKALGLKAYAEHMTRITQTLKEVNKYLDENEQKIAKKLDEAYNLTQKGLEKATVVVSVIREQCSALSLVLSDVVPGQKYDKLWAACQYFSTFAKDIEVKVNEAQDALREASGELYSARNDIRSIIKTLKRVHEEYIEERKAAEAAARAGAYPSALAGLLAGPIGLIISFSIAAAVTEAHTIPKIEEDFANQRKIISGYIDGFENMYSETETLQKRLDEKRDQLIDIHAKLSATGSLAGNTALSAMPLLHFATVRSAVEDLQKACEEFLKSLQWYSAPIFFSSRMDSEQ